MTPEGVATVQVRGARPRQSRMPTRGERLRAEAPMTGPKVGDEKISDRLRGARD